MSDIKHGFEVNSRIRYKHEVTLVVAYPRFLSAGRDHGRKLRIG